MREHRLDLRSKDQRSVDVGIDERLLAEAVPREDEPTLLLVPQSDREHAAEPIDEVQTPLVVRVREDLGVAARPEDMAGPLELLTELLEVIDLPVLDGEDVTPPIRHRLVTVGEVDDRE